MQTRVLLVTDSLGCGGAEKILCFVANNLNREKFKVGILNFNSIPTAQKLNPDVAVYDKVVIKKRIIRRLIQIMDIVAVVKDFKPHVILSFKNMPNLLSVLAGRYTRIPVVISERSDPTQKKSFIARVFRWLYGYANGAVFQIPGAKAWYSERLQRKSCIIPNPVLLSDNTITANYDSPENAIAFVARFENVQKRQDIMLKAFKIVSEKRPEMVLKFYGTGPDEDYIKKMAVEMGLDQKVVFIGLSSNPLKEICNTRMFVITSDYEGIPNALIEAMSIGLPVVSTDCSPGGARFLIEDGVNGLLVPAGDHNAVAQAILKYLDDPEFARRCGSNARKIRERFVPEVIISQWEQYINQIAEGKNEHISCQTSQ